MSAVTRSSSKATEVDVDKRGVFKCNICCKFKRQPTPEATSFSIENTVVNDKVETTEKPKQTMENTINDIAKMQMDVLDSNMEKYKAEREKAEKVEEEYQRQMEEYDQLIHTTSLERKALNEQGMKIAAEALEKSNKLMEYQELRDKLRDKIAKDRNRIHKYSEKLNHVSMAIYTYVYNPTEEIDSENKD